MAGALCFRLFCMDVMPGVFRIFEILNWGDSRKLYLTRILELCVNCVCCDDVIYEKN